MFVQILRKIGDKNFLADNGKKIPLCSLAPLPEEESEYGEDGVDLTRGDREQELPEDTYGASQYVSNFLVFTVFIIRQAHLLYFPIPETS